MFGKKKKKKKVSKEVIEDTSFDEDEEEVIIRRRKPEAKKKWTRFDYLLRIVTSVMIFGCVGMLGYAAFLLIYDSTNSTATAETYITIGNKSIEQSKKIFAEFGKKKQKKAADFAVLGTKFFLSESKITPSLLSSSNSANIVGEGNSNLYMYNLDTDSSISLGRSFFESNIYYIDLNHVDEGDYLIYSDALNSSKKSDYNPYSLSTNMPILYSTYTLPDKETNTRKRITIKNNFASPYLVINVKNAGSVLPSDMYDAVLYPAQYHLNDTDELEKTTPTSEQVEAVKEIAKTWETSSYKVKVVSSLQEAFDTKATLSFAISDTLTEDFTSLYTLGDNTTLKTKVLSDTALQGYDYYPEIRELTSYLGMAGQRYVDVKGNDTTITYTTPIGKESFMLAKSENISDKINSIFLK